MTDLVSWWGYVLRYEARELWRALPGPWWVKALLITVCLAIPGPADEVILLGAISLCRARRRRSGGRYEAARASSVS